MKTLLFVNDEDNETVALIDESTRVTVCTYEGMDGVDDFDDVVGHMYDHAYTHLQVNTGDGLYGTFVGADDVNKLYTDAEVDGIDEIRDGVYTLEQIERWRKRMFDL